MPRISGWFCSENIIKFNPHLTIFYLKIILNLYRPFSIVEGQGLRHLVKKLINVGAKYGQVENIDNILPDRTTISRRLENVVRQAKQDLVQRLANIKYFECAGSKHIL